MTQEEKDRAAAEKVYRAAFAEQMRVMASESELDETPGMRRTMTGNYLSFANAQRMSGIYTRPPGTLVGVSVGAGTSTKLPVIACQDMRKTEVFDRKSGERRVLDGSRLFVENVMLVKRDGIWKVAKLVDLRELPKQQWEAQTCQEGGY